MPGQAPIRCESVLPTPPCPLCTMLLLPLSRAAAGACRSLSTSTARVGKRPCLGRVGPACGARASGWEAQHANELGQRERTKQVCHYRGQASEGCYGPHPDFGIGNCLMPHTPPQEAAWPRPGADLQRAPGTRILPCERLRLGQARRRCPRWALDGSCGRGLQGWINLATMGQAPRDLAGVRCPIACVGAVFGRQAVGGAFLRGLMP
jgi:hypothetical protein